MKYQWAGAFIASGLICSPPGSAEEEAEEMGEITVIANRLGKTWIDASGSVLQVNSDELLRMGSQDLAGFAKYDPTVSLPFDFASGDGAYAYGQSGYGSINIRGVEGNRIAMELDGVRQPPQYVSTSFDMGSDDGAGGVGRDYFDPAMFEMIEVLKGGSSALYGSDALGGVVSFRTPEPQHFLGEGTRGGLLRTQYFSVNESVALQAGGATRVGDTSFLFLGAYREGNETANNGKVAPNPAEFDSFSALLKAEHRWNDHVFRAAYERFQRDTFIDARSAAESPFVLFDDYVHNRQYLERQRASVKWEYAPAGRALESVDTHLYWQESSSRSESDSASKPWVIGGVPVPGTSDTRRQSIEFDTDIFGLSTLARLKFGTEEGWSYHMLAGLDASLEKSENRFFRETSGMPSDRVSFSPSETERAGIFIQNEFAYARKWFITPGLRLDWHRIDPNPSTAYLERLDSLGNFGYAPPETYENVSLSPRLNLAWKPRETFQLYASYAHGVRNPTAEEVSMIFDHPADGTNPAGAMTIPNPNLEEEKSHAFEIGAKGENHMGRFQAALFYTRYSDFIENGVRTGDTDEDGRDILTTMNRGKAEIFGFETGGVLELGGLWSKAEGWEVGLSTGKTVGIDREADTWINSVEPWKTVAFIGYDDPEGRFGARMTGVYTDKVTRVNDETDQGEFYRPPSWFTLDLAAYWKPSETLTLHAGLNNIFDEKYWNWGSVRRGNGHLGGNSVTDRSTAPGRNFSISLTKTF